MIFLKRKIYRVLSYIAPHLVKPAGIFNEKIAEGIKARKGLKSRWRDKCRNLDREKKIVWFHVASVGEFLQAKPVICLLSERLASSVDVALTFYSPSGIKNYSKFSLTGETEIINFVDYLPFDTPVNARFCLNNLNPDIIIYVHSDLWPNLIMEASKAAIPQILISGTLSSKSKRLSPLIRSFYGEMYSLLDSIAAISDKDAERFKKYGRKLNIFTAGDTRFDQVIQRIEKSDVKPPGITTTGDNDFIIAGSTWPEDEKVVIPGFGMLLKDYPELRLILAPHEPTEKRISEIKAVLGDQGIDYHLLSSIDQKSSDTSSVIIADGVGYLAELYRYGSLAYIGGSFTTGVHNVMEPSIFSLPTLFGPRINNSFEALKLVSLGAGTIVETPEEFAQTASKFLGNRKLLESCGETASEFIRSNSGASEISYKLIFNTLYR